MTGCGEPRTEFPEHPYEQPYEIQKQFMQELWQTLQNSQIGLFESPTGTGKTISIICGALHWLEDFRAQQAQEALASCGAGADGDDTPDWLREAAVAVKKAAEPEAHPWLRRPGRAAALLANGADGGPPATAPARLGGWTEGRPLPSHRGGTAAVPPLLPHGAEAEDEFLLQPTPAEAAAVAAAEGGDGGVGMRRRPRGGALGDSSGGSSGDEGGGGDEASLAREALRALRAPPGPPPPRRRPQVFFASRTHSQLAQFVGELRKTGFASRLRLVSLAGRRGLCVHEPVAALGAAGLINERCTELQERNKGTSKARKTAPCAAGGGGGCSGGGTGGAATAGRPRGGRKAGGGGGGACPFLSPSLEEAEAFAHEVAAAPLDVEDLARLGRRRRLCPYYGARSLLPEADVVALPYSALLCADTRSALGLELSGAVVVFDEAHNLADAVTGSHGATVTAAQLATAKRQLSAYFERFQLRLSPSNARSLQLLLRLAAALESSLAPPPAAAPPSPPPAASGSLTAPAASVPSSLTERAGPQPQTQPPPQTQAQQQRQQQPAVSPAAATAAAAGSSEVVCVGEFLVRHRLEHVNLFPLLGWAKDSRLVMKVAGYDLASTPAADIAGDTAAASGGGATAKGVGGAAATASAQAALLDLHQDPDLADEEADLDLAEGRAGLASQMAAARRRGGGGSGGGGRNAAVAGTATAAAAAAATATAVAAATAGGFGARRSALFAFVLFLTALTHPSADGRIVISPGGGAGEGSSSSGGSGSSSGGGGGCLRYTVLNAAAAFAGVVAAARSVVLASGTLSPVQGLVAQLLPAVPPWRLRHFACGHVVPACQLAALVAARGPTGLPLQLSHGRRGEPRVMEELGRLLVNICTAVPAGVVVFAPSFAYLDQLVCAWQRTGVYGALASRKRVFVEPRTAGQVEAVLQDYAATIRSCSGSAGSSSSGGSSSSAGGGGGSIMEAETGAQPPQAQGVAAAPRRRLTGALLLSVVGGKLSEGINFGDDLGRCVVVLGLPYPNPSDPELRERMRYLDEAAAVAAAPAAAVAAAPAAAVAAPVSTAAAAPGAGVSGTTAGTAAALAAAPATPCAPAAAAPRLTGRQYYSGLCIKAVNQCVGRVIRHARDYAAVVLVDERYLPPPHFQPPQHHQPMAAASNGSGAAAASGGGGGGGAVIGSLPRWVLSSLRTSPEPGVTGSFAHVHSTLTGFFKSRQAGEAAAATAAAAPATAAATGTATAAAAPQ